MDDKVDDLKGRAKEAAGDLTDNDDLKRDGQADRAGATIKGKLKDAQKKGEELVDDVKDKLHHKD